MNDFIKIVIKKGKVIVIPLKEVTKEDFQPVLSGEGTAVSFINLFCGETSWQFKSQEKIHTAELKIAWQHAPELARAVKQGEVCSAQYAYLIDLWKVYSSVLKKTGGDKMKDKLKGMTAQEEEILYAKAVEQFNKSLKMLKILSES